MKLRRSSISGLAILAASIVFPAAATRAQGKQGPIAPKPGAAVQKAPDSTIRVRIALVNAPVTVTDAKGELVLDLQQNNFHVSDNGVEQAIETFDLAGEPLSAVLV